MKDYSCTQRLSARSRREFLMRSGMGFGSLALGCLLHSESVAASSAPSLNPLAPKAPHFAAKARSVIFIFLQGGLSQVDSFDPKPELTRLHGQFLPPSFLKRLTLAQIKAEESKLLGSHRPFKRYGQLVWRFRIYLKMSPNMLTI